MTSNRQRNQTPIGSTDWGKHKEWKERLQLQPFLLCAASNILRKKVSFVCKWVLVTLLVFLMLPFSVAGATANSGVNGDIESSYYIGIDFPFDYYGGFQDGFSIHRNGAMQFQRGVRRINPLRDFSENTCLPGDYYKNNTLFVFSDELQTHVEGKPSGEVLYDIQGEAPYRKLIVQWTDMYFADTGLPMGTFQAILYETTNQIKFQYLALNGERASGSQATIGIQGQEIWRDEEEEAHVQFKQIGCHQANLIRPGQAITFTPVKIKDAEWEWEQEWDYVVDLNAEFENIRLYDLTPFASGSTPEDYWIYASQALDWEWKSYSEFNNYEIEISTGVEWDPSVIALERVENANHFSYTEGLIYGEGYIARVRADLGNGKWTPWSGYSRTIYVDTKKPTSQIKAFLRMDDGAVWLNINAFDDYSGIASTKTEIATDEAFENIVYEDVREGYPSALTLNDLPQSGTLYVRSDAVDKAGNHSGYTPVYVIIDKPVVNSSSRYSKERLFWDWARDSRYVSFEYEALTEEGEVVKKGNQSAVYNNVWTDYSVHGKTVRARVRGQISDGWKWGAWSHWSSPTTIDRVAPTASLNTFNRTGPGSVAVSYSTVDDLSGVKTIMLEIATDSDFSYIYKKFTLPVDATSFEVNNLESGISLYARIKAIDAVGNESGYTGTLEVGLEPPHIQSPANGMVVHHPVVTVSGIAPVGTEVQMYLNENALDTRIPVGAYGTFSGQISLDAEGVYKINADARNSTGTSELSSVVQVDYKIPLPVASFVTPSNGSTIAAPLLIEVMASDILGIAKVEFYDGETLLGSVTEAPYQYQWGVGFTDNGAHNLKAVVTNTGGKSVTIEQTVEVDVAPEEVPLPPTEYTGKVENISPAISYGDQTIRISGIAMDRASSAPMANSALKLVLDVSGFKRIINIVSDETGAFSYNFIPQITDKGTYQVFVIHPDEVGATAQGSFNINRISFDINGYKLTAARNFPSQFAVTATASGDVGGLKWLALPEDQPTGALPQGITINGGNGIDLAEGKSASMNIVFKADDTAQATGSIVLKAFAQNTGEMVRGTLQLDYKLVQAQSYLYIPKNSIQTGVQQGDSVSETITLKNNGLLAAQNVRVELQDEHGNKPPSWMFMANTGEIGAVSVGDEISLQVTAQPDSNIADGVYRFKLHIVADNGPSADAYITVAVTQSGIGGIRFSVADIYTATLDADEQPILGVAGASIKLQNEAVLTEQYTATTGNDGTALFEDLPPGVYLFRASAPNHTDVSGRIRIRPGVVTDQHIFLDYQLINIEFGVTETTINDIYDIVLEAIYQTQVPAPVVLLEPLSINVGGMQAGEERTGQLTLSNYGLIEAQTVKFTPPKTDSEFKYEFFGDIPDTLPPKTRIVIPYRVTALSNKQGRSEAGGDEAGSKNESPIKTLMAPSTRAAQCTSYTSRYWVDYEYECINGERRKNGNGGYYSYLKGQHCTGSGINWGTGGGSGGGWGGGGGGWGAPSSMPMTSECIPECPSGLCDTGGMAGNR